MLGNATRLSACGFAGCLARDEIANIPNILRSPLDSARRRGGVRGTFNHNDF